MAPPTSLAGRGGGFLGAKYDPFMAGDPSTKDYKVHDLVPPDGISLDRIGRRREILKQFNESWRAVETEAKLNSFDPAMEQAYSMVFSAKVREAVALGRRPSQVKE